MTKHGWIIKLKQIKRYRMIEYPIRMFNSVVMEERPNGEWVRYSDIKEMLENPRMEEED